MPFLLEELLALENNHFYTAQLGGVDIAAPC